MIITAKQMKEKTYFTSYDVWEYITVIDIGESTDNMSIQRFVPIPDSLRSKFVGYSTTPVFSVSGNIVSNKTITFFSHDCFIEFLENMPDGSMVLYRCCANYALVGCESDHATLDSIPVVPYLHHDIKFRYFEID